MSFPRSLALLLPIILSALGLRLLGITDIGVGGSDTILYFTLAESWHRGDFVFRIGDSTTVFRPVLLAFNGMALSAFGHTDAAIKLANVSADALNMCLLATLAWMTHNPMIAFTAGAYLVFCFVYVFPIKPLEGYDIWVSNKWLWLAVWLPVLLSFFVSLPDSLAVIL